MIDNKESSTNMIRMFRWPLPIHLIRKENKQAVKNPYDIDVAKVNT